MNKNQDVIKLANSLGVSSVIIFFPYNQKELLIPDKHFWNTYADSNSLLCVSPNTIIQSAPESNLVILTENEMTFNYLSEIKNYISNLINLQKIKIIASDIHLPRIKRDFHIVFAGLKNKLDIQYEEIKLPPSFWKTVYAFREWMTRHLPLKIYKLIAKKEQK